MRNGLILFFALNLFDAIVTSLLFFIPDVSPYDIEFNIAIATLADILSASMSLPLAIFLSKMIMLAAYVFVGGFIALVVYKESPRLCRVALDWVNGILGATVLYEIVGLTWGLVT